MHLNKWETIMKGLLAPESNPVYSTGRQDTGQTADWQTEIFLADGRWQTQKFSADGRLKICRLPGGSAKSWQNLPSAADHWFILELQVKLIHKDDHAIFLIKLCLQELLPLGSKGHQSN
jgi:hypothetical protein